MLPADIMRRLTSLVRQRPETHAELIEWLGVLIAARASATRAQWERLRVAATGDAGLIQRRRSRATRTTASIYDSAASGIEADPTLPYTIVCEDHATCVSVATLGAAREFAPDPRSWCDDCREAAEARG